MDEALFALLTGSAAVADLCDGRVFWGVAPQGAARPYIALNVIGGADRAHMKGVDGFWRYRVQVDCYGDDRPAARAVSRAVTDLLHGYHAASGIVGAFIDSTRDGFEEAAAGHPSRMSMDFRIIWSE